MKKYLFILLALFCLGSNRLDAANGCDKPSQKPLIIKNLKNIVGIERSEIQDVIVEFGPYNITIEFEVPYVGDGNIYLLDSTNSVIDYQELFTGISSYSIATPSNGTYTIVIISEYFYGEGYFEI